MQSFGKGLKKLWGILKEYGDIEQVVRVMPDF
jgi:hypothetical protein